MGESARTFARILTQGVKTIALLENKPIHVVEDELGHALGKKGRPSIEYWRKGHVPAKTSDVETLAWQLVKRKGIQDAITLERFLDSAEYPYVQPLLKKLEPLPNEKASIPSMPTQPNPQQQNPFIIGPPIREPHQFFGRTEALERIFGVWQQLPLQNVAVIGLKRSGKTSLLHYLRQITQTPTNHLRPGQPNNWLPQPERYQWAFVDFVDPSMGSRDRLLRHLLTSLKLPIPDPCSLYDFIDTVGGHLQTPSIILMDEIKGGLASPDLDLRFWRSLRSLGTNYTQGNLAFVLTAHESPAKLAQDEGKTSPFFNIFGHTLQLEPLTDMEASELIASSPQPFDTADIDWILAESGRWPCMVQALCHVRFATLETDQRDDWKQEALRQIEPYRHLLG